MTVRRGWRAITTPRHSALYLLMFAVLTHISATVWQDLHAHSPKLRPVTVGITCESLGGTDCTKRATVTGWEVVVYDGEVPAVGPFRLNQHAETVQATAR